MCRSARRPVWMFLAASLVLLALSAPPGSAQNVRWERTGFRSVRRTADNAAEAQGRGDWPRLDDGDRGTQVHVTFDLRNADVVLMTPSEYGQQALLAQARRIAEGLGRPRADYILFTGTKTVTTDIELNKYLIRPDSRHTRADLDLAALAAALRASPLPRPIVLYVSAEEADSALLTVPGAASSRRLGEKTFFGLSEVPAGARLQLAASIPWYAPLIALGFGALLLSALGTMILTPWRLARRPSVPAVPAEATPPDPADVQRRYNKQPPLWTVTALVPLGFLLLSLLGNPHWLMAAAMYSLPWDPNSPAMLFLPAGMGALMVLSWGAATFTRRRRARAEATAAPAAVTDPDAPPAWTQQWFLWVCLASMLPMMLFVPFLLSGYVHLHGAWVRTLPLILPGSFFALLAGGGWLAARATRTTLAADDPWRRLVDEVAAQAGVRVRHVVRVQSPTINAYASIFGTVGLTSGLLRRMEPAEVRAVVAHEVGHLKAGHTRRGFVVGLLVWAAVWAAWWYGARAARPHVPSVTYHLLNSPMVGIFLIPLLMNLLLGRGRRRREEEADRFAVEATGDPELVIHTLTKLHTLNASPHQLKASDEVLHSHPSLIHRIEAIRRGAPAGPFLASGR